MAQSNIEWTDYTWNIARGCTKVDADCKFCYMYRDSMNGTRYDPIQVTKTKTVFNLPLKIKEPSKIFTSSLTDVFHVGCDSFRNEVWDIIRQCPQHIFQILTKRPERIVECTPEDILQMDNVWFGTSCGSEAGTERIRELIKIDCKHRFVSFEPMHEAVDMNWDLTDLLRIDWVIIGGESGNETGKYGYRPCHISWLIGLVMDFDGVCPIFVKQLGTSLSKTLKMSDRHGRNMDEFPTLLRRREFPKEMMKLDSIRELG